MLNFGHYTIVSVQMILLIKYITFFVDLTVGGLLMGFGLENNSHIYGMFHETCVAYEIVTGDGRLLRCTENENSDLFRTLPVSHGKYFFMKKKK